MGRRRWTMANTLDLPRHGPNSFKLDGSVDATSASVILDKVDEVRRAFRAVDPRGTGLVAEKDFKKVLYIEAGVAYNDVSIILATAPAKGGFVGYDTWIVDFLNKHQPADSSFRTQKPADAHPAQEVEEIKRVVVENAGHLLTTLRVTDLEDTGLWQFRTSVEPSTSNVVSTQSRWTLSCVESTKAKLTILSGSHSSRRTQ